MTTISVTFLICLSDSRPFFRRSKGKSAKSLGIANDESKILKDLKSIQECQFESCSKYVVLVDRPIKYVQIDYEIIPKFTYYIDIVFWGPIVRVATKESVKCMSSITKLQHMWITFTVEHKVSLDIPDLMVLKSHNISFNMHVEKPNVPSNNIADETSFFFQIEDIDLKCLFIEAFDYIPTNETDGLSKAEEDVKIILQDLLRFAFKGEIINNLKITDICGRKKILNMINLFAAKIDYKCYNTYSTDQVIVADVLKIEKPAAQKRKTVKLDDSKSKKSVTKTKKKSAMLDNTHFELIVPGEVLFTDPKMTTFKFLKKSTDMKCGYVIINVDNLITPIQRNILSPIVIKLNKLVSVPVDVLHKERFEHLYLSYDLCDINYITGAKPITEQIYFRSHKIYFLEKRAEILAQLAQKDYLIVQIHGIRTRIIKTTPGIFGTHPLDEIISEPLKNRRLIAKLLNTKPESYYENTLIAVACFKLDMLLSSFRSLSETEFCIHPSRCPVKFLPTVTEEQADNSFTVNSINIDNASDKAPVYPISADLLLESELGLEARVELHRPINKLLNNIIQKEVFYNRIILITGHMELTKYILSNVFTHNSCWIYKEDIVPPNYLPNYESTTDINNVNIISGFSIDNGDIYIMYLEGNAKWIKNVLWQHIKNENFTCAKVLYNSDHVYKDRVYTNLIPYGGVCNITLHTSLKAVLDSSKIFAPGYLPEPCRRAFEKIDMILKSKSTNEIPMSMLPTSKELLSLDIEWGVPIYWPIKNSTQ